jgi:hypothetical protein
LQHLNEGVKERLTWAGISLLLALGLLIFRHPVISCVFAGMAGGQLDSIIKELRATIRAEKIIKGYRNESNY